MAGFGPYIRAVDLSSSQRHAVLQDLYPQRRCFGGPMTQLDSDVRMLSTDVLGVKRKLSFIQPRWDYVLLLAAGGDSPNSSGNQ
jgi:hypothetical protein